MCIFIVIVIWVNYVYFNVFCFCLQVSFLQFILLMVFGYLLCVIQVWFELFFFEWIFFLQFIFKKQKKNWEEEFEVEKVVYVKLYLLQGIIVLRFFGEFYYDNMLVFFMLYIGGVCLVVFEGGMLELDEFCCLVCQVFIVFFCFGVLQDDVKLDNFYLIDGKVMVVDFEMMINEVQEFLMDEQFKFGVECEVDDFVKGYEDIQYCFWEDGIFFVGGE